MSAREEAFYRLMIMIGAENAVQRWAYIATLHSGWSAL